MRRLRLITAAALAVVSAAALPAATEAKVSIRFANGLLKIHSGKRADRATVACNAGGLVKVNARDPRAGPVECSQVAEVNALMGAGNDRVNLSGIDGRFGRRDLPGFGQGTGAAAALGAGNDRLTGSFAAFNLAFGGSGNDRLLGGGVRDLLQGGGDNDKLAGRDGNDVLVGRAGADKGAGGPGDDLISGNAGDDRLMGGPGNDLIGGGLGIDRLFGGLGDDRLVGGPQKDRLNGGGGNNEVFQDGPKG
ncbi:MAG: calcium-binding protein [Solirubrobacterales bacterium]